MNGYPSPAPGGGPAEEPTPRPADRSRVASAWRRVWTSLGLQHAEAAGHRDAPADELRHPASPPGTVATIERFVAFVLLVALLITAIITFDLLPRPYNLEVGQVAPQTIKAPDRRTFTSQILTKQEREIGAARVEDVTKLDQSVRLVRVTVEKGETIVRDGEIVKPLDLEKLEAIGLLNPSVGWGDIAGALLLALVATATIGIYLLMFLPRLLANNRRLLLLALILVMSALAVKLIVPGREIYAYAFPLAAAPMLIAALLDVRLALLAASVLGLFFGQIVGGQFDLIVIQSVAGWIAALGVWRAERVMQFFLAGLAVALADCLLFLGLSLSNPDLGPGRLAMFAFVFLAQGGLVSALTVGTFTVLGYIFGIVTTIHLLELAHPNQPLLRRLSMEAPGTYHHSIVVANLAERAAELIGADSLLTRVGAYYHDIGKALRPGYFIDNQMPDDNVHDQLDPEESSEIILAHVRDGLRLARQYRVPARIRDFIAEHHGTRLVTYFYHRACQKSGAVDPDDYRYPGPRPQSRETAIVMLADSVEAAVRSCHNRSSDRIDALVDKIVAERLAEGELDECDLTIRDVHTIREAFKTTLRGVYHPRVEYPERDRPATPQLPPGRPAKVGSSR